MIHSPRKRFQRAIFSFFGKIYMETPQKASETVFLRIDEKSVSML